MEKKYDFSGYATRNDICCSDGRTIRKNAFKKNDGQKVPLVWNHNHTDVDRVLGHALLENRDDGVYAYCSFNNTEQGRNAKELVLHGDITALSIYANQLKQNGKDVIHGSIKEVSLVLAGANPGAYIETIMAHSEDGETVTDEAIIYNLNETFEFHHSEEDETENETSQTKEEQKVDENVKEESEETIQDVVDSMTDKQRSVLYYIVGLAKAESNNQKSETDNEEDTGVKHNVFDNETNNSETVLTHDEFATIIKEAKQNGSLKETFLAHGIKDITEFLPEAQTVTKTPEMIRRDVTWVDKVLASVHRTPFSKIKSMAANITEEQARAKGYIKGNQKKEVVFSALKRTTSPQTIYIKQSLDRDDILDITDFNVVDFVKQEMRGLLREEQARALLIGDGRSMDAEDKIQPTNIRPILGDNSVYTVSKELVRDKGDSDETFANNFIKTVKKSRKDYKGSGYPSLYVTEDLLTDMLLIEDKNGRVMYDTLEKLTTALRVKEIIPVPVFDNVVRTNDDETFDYKLMGILVNLIDYNIGADKEGTMTFFEDFDIDYNKEKYLLETRCSGALVKPYSAITFEEKTAHLEPAKG